jgi:WD40 repeat protein
MAVLPPADLLIVGYGTGRIRILSTSDPSVPVRELKVPDQVQAVAATRWRGRDLVFATIGRQGHWSVRAWDLKTLEPFTLPGQWSLGAGESDKVLYGLAVHSDERAMRVAFACRYGKIIVAELGAQRRSSLPINEEWKIPGAGDCYTNCLQSGWSDKGPILIAGTQEGQLVVWQFVRGECIAARARAHSTEILAVALSELGARSVIASGSIDGVVQLWTTSLELLQSVVIGEPVKALTWAGSGRLAVGTLRGVLMLEMHVDTSV